MCCGIILIVLRWYLLCYWSAVPRWCNITLWLTIIVVIKLFYFVWRCRPSLHRFRLYLSLILPWLEFELIAVTSYLCCWWIALNHVQVDTCLRTGWFWCPTSISTSGNWLYLCLWPWKALVVVDIKHLTSYRSKSDRWPCHVTLTEKRPFFLQGMGPVMRHACPSWQDLTRDNTFLSTMTGIWAIKLTL